MVIRGPQRTVALPIPGIYPWLERIRPFLDGSRRLDELVAELPPQAADHVRTLVELLVREGFVRDAEGDLRHGLSPEVRTRHSALIDFIALRADSPEARFERYRNCAPVVVGFGRLASALVLALLTSGVQLVRFRVVTAEGRTGEPTDMSRLAECIELLQKEGMSIRYEAVYGEPRNLPPDTGVVLLATDEFEPELTERVRALASRDGLGYGQLTASGRHAFISLQKQIDESSDLLDDGGSDGPYLGGPTAALAANQLCLQLLCQVAELDEPADGGETPAPGVAVLDLATARFLTARPA